MLYQLVLDRKPKVAYQIGTFVGYSALVIADALRANGGGILLAVDPEVPHRTFVNPVDVAREMARARGLDKYIRFERGWHCVVSGDYISIGLKRRVPIVGAQVLDSVREQGVDLAFIDGDHSTASTLADFLLLRDYLNVNGIAVFHDVQSWPSVAQAIFTMWHDNFYYRSNTARYFAIDVRAGKDGLAILKRIRDESRPTLCLILVNQNGQPIPNVRVEIPSANFTTINGEDGKMFVDDEFPAGIDVRASCPGYQTYTGKLEKGTEGDFVENTIVLRDA
jgi:predicted O-methyltransferase YrrM